MPPVDESTFPYSRHRQLLKAPYVRRSRPGPTATWPSSASPSTRARPSRPGARYGPRAHTRGSTIWAYRSGAERALRRRGRRLRCWTACASSTPATSSAADGAARGAPPAISGRVQAAARRRPVPLVLGGDHSITYPVLQGLRRGGGLHLVQLDTHMDYWDDEGGMRYTHASPIIRAHEDGLVSGVTPVRHPWPAHGGRQHRAGRRAAACARSGASRPSDAGRGAGGPHRAGRSDVRHARHRRPRPGHRARHRHARAGRLQLLRGQGAAARRGAARASWSAWTWSR